MKIRDRKTYSTRRLLLRPLELNDFQAWVTSQERAEPARNKFDTSPVPQERRTRAVFNKSVRRQHRQSRADSVYVWNIVLKKTGELVGHMDINPIMREPYMMANLGYYIINTYRGNGYAKEALRKLISHAFKDLDLHRLEAVIDVDNKASIALAKKSGLHREGIKKHYWFQNGRWEDQLIFIATPELFC
jgi:ribosomal-protein-alanine N-acetyltransferase